MSVPIEPVIRRTPVIYEGASSLYLELRMTDGSDEGDLEPSWSIWEVLDDRRLCLASSVDMGAMERSWRRWSMRAEYTPPGVR